MQLLILNTVNFYKSTEIYSHFLKIKIYSIGFNYSFVTSKKLAICLLKMTLEHSSVAYFQVILAHFQWYQIFVKLLDIIFLNNRSKGTLLETSFIEE